MEWVDERTDGHVIVRLLKRWMALSAVPSPADKY